MAATEQPIIEALRLYDAARLGAAGAVRHRLASLATQVDGWFVATLAVAAAGLAANDARPLEQAAVAFAEHGHDLRAAEAAASAGRLHQLAGRLAKARAWRERALALTDAFPEVRTPALALDDVCAVLTRREREIALLATTLSSRQVAERLALSVRTVDNHLARSFAKLGVTSRRELAAALGMDGAGRQ